MWADPVHQHYLHFINSEAKYALMPYQKPFIKYSKVLGADPVKDTSTTDIPPVTYSACSCHFRIMERGVFCHSSYYYLKLSRQPCNSIYTTHSSNIYVWVYIPPLGCTEATSYWRLFCHQ